LIDSVRSLSVYANKTVRKDGSLKKEQITRITNAITSFDFPSIVYDFKHEKELVFQTIQEVEAHIRNSLTSNDPVQVKDGLSNIVYWGESRSGYRSFRVGDFRRRVTAHQLDNATGLFPTLEGTSLREIKKIGLPRFSNMTFVSKIRMFLDPSNYVVLDLKLMKLGNTTPQNIFSRMNRQETHMPLTTHNESCYEEWCTICRCAGSQYWDPPKRAVDVERGIYQLVDESHGSGNGLGQIAQIVNDIETRIKRR